MPSIAIVGTRRPSVYGQETTYRFSYDLARQGVTIVSGLALGVDSIAHKAAIDAGGKTIAVLPSGLDNIYPFSHRSLAERIVNSGGALLSEYPTGTTAFKANFIARNRIVAGLSDGLLVTEAAERSGTASTAAFALEQNRPVMAVPGNITSPMSTGCNNLIKHGARLVSGTEDILEELGLKADRQIALALAYSDEEQIIISLLSTGLRDGDEIQTQSGLSAGIFSQTLTTLEIEGKIRALGANQWGL